MPLKKTKYKGLVLDWRRCEVWEGVVGNANDCGRVYVPVGWINKKIFVVLKND